MRRSAEHGFTSLWRSAEHGFTLIELLVVLAIAGMMSAVVVLAISNTRVRLIEEAETFAARAVAARDMAIVNARTTRLSVDAHGYGFAERRGGQWTEFADRPLRPARWTEGTEASPAEIEFDPAGLAEPEARILLRRGDEQAAISISADGGVHVTR